MKNRLRQRDAGRPGRWSVLGLAVGLIGLPGCGSPPSVTPLLQVASRAMVQEIAQQQADIQRDSQTQRERAQALQDAFEADLAQRESLDAGWVQSTAHVYAQAMAQLARHEASLQAQRQTRIDNLRLAADAQSRALQLLELQDQWIQSTLGLDLWRLEQSSLLFKENR